MAVSVPKAAQFYAKLTKNQTVYFAREMVLLWFINSEICRDVRNKLL